MPLGVPKSGKFEYSWCQDFGARCMQHWVRGRFGFSCPRHDCNTMVHIKTVRHTPGNTPQRHSTRISALLILPSFAESAQVKDILSGLWGKMHVTAQNTTKLMNYSHGNFFDFWSLTSWINVKLQNPSVVLWRPRMDSTKCHTEFVLGREGAARFDVRYSCIFLHRTEMHNIEPLSDGPVYRL